MASYPPGSNPLQFHQFAEKLHYHLPNFQIFLAFIQESFAYLQDGFWVPLNHSFVSVFLQKFSSPKCDLLLNECVSYKSFAFLEFCFQGRYIFGIAGICLCRHCFQRISRSEWLISLRHKYFIEILYRKEINLKKILFIENNCIC